MNKFIRIHPKDTVLVALEPISTGEILTIGEIKLKVLQDIPRGHKISLYSLSEGEDIIKYGAPIGHATVNIAAGEHIHTHNIATNLSENLEYRYTPKLQYHSFPKEDRHFMGYQRADGNVGIRNELWIIPSVGCVNGQAELIAKRFNEEFASKDIDGIFVFKHNYGCSQLGDDHINTRTVLGNMARHPNAGGVLFLGLGCENNQIKDLRSSIGEYDPNRIKFLIAQDVEDEIEEGFRLVKEIYEAMRYDYRVECPLSSLKIGLKCGGSDGLSGITANPLLGVFSDYLISQGGTTVLTEVPEMFGAETLLMERAVNEQVFNKTVSLINNFKDYFRIYNQPVYENPSPGNKAGGITTLEDKSLGCTQKGGSAPVMDVLAYGEMIKNTGLNLLSAPGNDLVATSALGFAGCQLVLFTTGRGTPFGSFIPTLKISTNNDLASKKANWIDFNAGLLLNDQNIFTFVKKFI
ncbi:MAG: altronate dehydratase family protein, partial [Bacteroidota bacterium]|nr:altronate dehydratase family protein [Bacteroidota bacterium]